MLNHVLQLHCAIFYSLNYFNDTYFFCKYKNVRDILAQFTIMMPLMMETCNILYSSLILVLLLFLAHTTNAHFSIHYRILDPEFCITTKSPTCIYFSQTS